MLNDKYKLGYRVKNKKTKTKTDCLINLNQPITEIFLEFFLEIDFQQTIKPSKLKCWCCNLVKDLDIFLQPEWQSNSAVQCHRKEYHPTPQVKALIYNYFMRFLCTNLNQSPIYFTKLSSQTPEFQLDWIQLHLSEPREGNLWAKGKECRVLLVKNGVLVELHVSAPWKQPGPAKDSLMRDTWQTVCPALLIQHTQYDDTLRAIVPHHT